METVLDPEWELESIRARLPKDPKPLDTSDWEQTVGARMENTGRAPDVSDFSDKIVKDKKDVKVGKLDSDNPFLKADKDAGGPKRKSGKRVIRDSPFKKSATIKGDDASPVSKNSGFKRQLTTGTRTGEIW
jgi:hypothetical protein